MANEARALSSTKVEQDSDHGPRHSDDIHKSMDEVQRADFFLNHKFVISHYKIH